ncbi:MAG: hypothetical protein WD887_00040 [Candidatus Saccharimonadales bacterium]
MPEKYNSSPLINEALFDSFEVDVTTLNLKDLVVPIPGRQLPDSFVDYSLAPIMPIDSDVEAVRSDTSYAITYDFRLPPGISPASGYRSSYLDTGLAIGLVFRSHVVGIAGAAVQPTAVNHRLNIKQIQGWEFKPLSREDYKESGLYGGFLWRHTLVAAWTALALKHGLEGVAIQSAVNNRSAHPSGPSFPRYLERYDRVAIDMGFQFEPETGNFVLDI